MSVLLHTFTGDRDGWGYLVTDLFSSVFSGAAGGLIFALLLGTDWSGRSRGGQ